MLINCNRFFYIKSLIVLIMFFVIYGCYSENKSVNAEKQSNEKQIKKQFLKLEKKPIGYDLEHNRILRFGKIPSHSSREIVLTHYPLMQYLKKTLKLKDVKLILAPTYKKLTDYLLDGKVDVAWHASLAYPEDMDRGLKAVLQPVRFGVDYYQGLIIAHKDSNIKRLSDFKGKSFAFSEKASASAYFYPHILFFENNIIPEKDFSKVEYIYGHDKIAYSVLYKRVDGGAVYDDARNLIKNKKQRSNLIIVAKTKKIPNEPIVVHKNLPDKWVKRIKEAFLKLKPTDDAIKALNNLDGFKELKGPEYNGVLKDIKLYKEFAKE